MVLCYSPCQAMGSDDSLRRAKTSCHMDAQQDHPKGNRELQNIIRAEGISAELEDKIMVKTGNRTIKQKPAPQHLLEVVKKVSMFKIGSVG